jgi:tetratricopeptide (TPR) repeat protein
MIAKALRHLLAPLCLLAAATGTASEAVAEAQQLIQDGRYERALTVLDNYLRSAPQDAEARFTRGLVLVRLDRTDDALQTFADLTRDYPQLPEPYNNLAVLYAQQGEYEKARNALEAALASSPGYSTAHENLGDVYAALAAAAYTRALTLDPDSSGARNKVKLLRQLDSLADSGAAVPPRAPPAEPAATPVAAADRDAIQKLVMDWAAAWSAQDVDRYLGFYGDEFLPEGGASRQAWQAQRRSRISAPGQIRIGVSGTQISSLGENRAQAMFQQEYASDQYADVATKVLELQKSGGQWRIVREYSR